MGRWGWHGDIAHSGFDPDIQSHENRFKGGSTLPDMPTHKDLFPEVFPLPIPEFQGEFRFLSNFPLVSVLWDGILFPSSEHAFQAAKTLDFQHRWLIAQLPRANQAKKAGGGVDVRSADGKKVICPGIKKLRPDWEKVKIPIMREIKVLQYFQNPEQIWKLMATGERPLIEGNKWHDTFWGVCNGKGENHLGKIQMEIRAFFQSIRFEDF